MARKYLMSWQGAPQYRWRKMYRGVSYVVTCAELRSPRLTQEGSGKLADDWWRAKKAEIDGLTPIEGIPDHGRRTLEAVVGRPLNSVPEVAQAALEMIERVNQQPIATYPIEQLEGVAAALRGQADPAEAGGAMREALDQTPTERTLKANALRWLDLIRGEVKPTSFREIKEFVRWFCALPITGENMDVAAVNEAKVEEAFLFLKKAKLSPATKKKRWGFFRRLVKYLWGRKLIDLPRNLDHFSITVHAKAVRKYDIAEVRNLLAVLKPRLRLYALLGLNCGMTNADIGQLRKDMVDLDGGTLTRKRVKTFEEANVPTVTYALWPETLRLMRRLQADHPTLFLTSSDNTSLWESRQEGDKTPHKDLVSKQWKKKKLPLPLKAFRSISATMLEKHAHYGRYLSHFLGHSPKSIRDKHYAAPSQELFDTIMTWLRAEILGQPTETPDKPS